MKKLCILLGVLFIMPDLVISFAQSNIMGELVEVETDDGIVLKGAIWTPPHGKAHIGVMLAHGCEPVIGNKQSRVMGYTLVVVGGGI
jgi:hypothetical protein